MDTNVMPCDAKFYFEVKYTDRDETEKMDYGYTMVDPSGYIVNTYNTKGKRTSFYGVTSILHRRDA